jgi:hypothetical protein
VTTLVSGVGTRHLPQRSCVDHDDIRSPPDKADSSKEDSEPRPPEATPTGKTCYNAQNDTLKGDGHADSPHLAVTEIGIFAKRW